MPGRVAAFASEWVAGFPSEWVAGFVGIRRDACLGEARVVARPWFHITRALCKGEARRRGVARRAGFGTRLPFRNPRPAFAPPPPEPGAGSSRAVGWGKASAMPRTLRGHGWGKFRWAGGCGIGCGRPGGPEAGCLAAGSRADTPALQDGGFDDDEAERREGGSSSASSLRGADLRGGKAPDRDGSTARVAPVGGAGGREGGRAGAALAG